MPHSRQTHIFATRSDLEPGLRKFEAEMRAKYARCGMFRDPIVDQFGSLTDWDGLGKNTTGNHITGECFLVVRMTTKLSVERVPQKDGGIRYGIDQLLNPDSITFLPGGIYDDQRILVCGHIGTASTTAASVALYKAFVKYVTKGFDRVGSYRVGPEALRLMDVGYRMVTISIGSPSGYDLRRA